MTAVATTPADDPGHDDAAEVGVGRGAVRGRRGPLHHLRRRDRPAPRGRLARSSWRSTSCATGSARTTTARSSASVFGIPQVIIDTLVEVSTTVLRTIGWPGLVAVAGARRLPRGRLADRGPRARPASSPSGSSTCGSRASRRSGRSSPRSPSRYAIGVPLGILDGAERAVRPAHLADPRRDADHADVRLPRAVRPVLRHRAGGRGDRHAHLRDARRRSGSRPSASGACRPTRSRRRQSLGATGSQLAHARSGSRWRAGARDWRSTRRSCSPSR